MTGNSDPPRPSDLPPGYDEEDPYEGEDLSTYPRWWRTNIQEHREHNLRPYRPPRFLDGALIPEIKHCLESGFGVEILLRSSTAQTPERWEVVVDDVAVSSIERERLGEGYSLFKITSGQFKDMVHAAVDG